MSDRDRLLAYLTGLVAVFVLAYVGGWLLGPTLGYDEEPAPQHPTGQTGEDHP